MKRSWLVRQGWFFALAVLILAAPAVVSAQEGSEASIAQATPQHELLARDVGTWDAIMTCYMEGPEVEPQTFKGVEVNTLMGGGLWLVSDFQGEFAGMPFSGHGVFGYDSHKEKHVGTWIDSMSTQLLVMQGTCDEQTGELTMFSEGSCPCPVTGKPLETKTVSTYDGDDARTFTMYMKGEDTGNEFIKVMVIEYKRRK